MTTTEQDFVAPDSMDEFGEREWDAIHRAICWDASDRMSSDDPNEEKISYLWDLADVIAEEKEVGNGGE